MTVTEVIPQWTKGDVLRKAREAAGLTQAELAQRLEIATTSVRRNPEPSDYKDERCSCGRPVVEPGAAVCYDCAFGDDAVVVDLASYRVERAA